MKVVVFCHSLISDWNHGNAHFLRGVVSELQARGHAIDVYEPEDAWSVQNLLADGGELPLAELAREYPGLTSCRYRSSELDLDRALDTANLVLVHEWNEPELVQAIGRHRMGSSDYVLLFHDTHHRAVSDSAAIAHMDLSGYDGVLAFGEAVRERYLELGWARRVFTWHEAADVRVFYPRERRGERRDLVWIGNWGDDERTRELHEFLLEPARALGLSARVHGVRYPASALTALAASGAQYAGFLPNYHVPRVFAEHKVTVHVPRAPYVRSLPGIPTIRVFEALACGIPLVSAPWQDVEELFRPDDFLRARDGSDMRAHLARVLADADLARALAASGRETILKRHTCAHRVDELLDIAERLGARNPRQEQVA